MSLNEISQEIRLFANLEPIYIMREVSRFPFWQVTLIGGANITCTVYEILNGYIINSAAYGPAPVIQHSIAAVCDTFLIEVTEPVPSITARFFGRN